MAGMRYEGLSHRTRPLRWGLFLGIVAIVVYGTGGSAWGSLTRWLTEEYDRLPWYVTRISALLAYLALTGSVIYGLLLSSKLLDRIAHRAVSFTLHQDLSSIGLALALVHAAVLMIDRSVPYSPSEVIVPFSGPYRPLWVGVGQITLAVTIVVLVSFYVRRWIGQPAWRRLHYLTFAVFVGATVHGLMAGTDTQAPWVFLGYLVMTVVVVFLLTYRIALAVGSSRAAPAAAAGESPAGRGGTTSSPSRGLPPRPAVGSQGSLPGVLPRRPCRHGPRRPCRLGGPSPRPGPGWAGAVAPASRTCRQRPPRRG